MAESDKAVQKKWEKNVVSFFNDSIERAIETTTRGIVVSRERNRPFIRNRLSPPIREFMSNSVKGNEGEEARARGRLVVLFRGGEESDTRSL